MFFNERDIALALDGHTRQLWAEKHLEMSPSDDEKAWKQWYDFLHNRVEQSLKTTLTGASDLTPRDPQEPFTPEYQSRLKAELGKPRNVIGAHVCGNAAVRVPLSCLKTGTNELQIYLLGLHPAKQNASKRDIAKFLYLKTFCVQSQMEPKFGVLGSTLQSPVSECAGSIPRLTVHTT